MGMSRKGWGSVDTRRAYHDLSALAVAKPVAQYSLRRASTGALESDPSVPDWGYFVDTRDYYGG